MKDYVLGKDVCSMIAMIFLKLESYHFSPLFKIPKFSPFIFSIGQTSHDTFLPYLVPESIYLLPCHSAPTSLGFKDRAVSILLINWTSVLGTLIRYLLSGWLTRGWGSFHVHTENLGTSMYNSGISSFKAWLVNFWQNGCSFKVIFIDLWTSIITKFLGSSQILQNGIDSKPIPILL